MKLLYNLKKTVMKLIPVLIVAIFFAGCGAPHKSGSKISSSKVMKHNSDKGEPEEVIVTGTERIPILGRNEAGIFR